MISLDVNYIYCNMVVTISFSFQNNVQVECGWNDAKEEIQDYQEIIY